MAKNLHSPFLLLELVVKGEDHGFEKGTQRGKSQFGGKKSHVEAWQLNLLVTSQIEEGQ